MSVPGRPSEMTASAVCGVLDVLACHGIRVWLDGVGGGCLPRLPDALAPRHRHRHRHRHSASAVAVLRGRGYVPVPRDDTSPWNFVLGDGSGHQVDFDIITSMRRATSSTARLTTVSPIQPRPSPGPGSSMAAAWTASRPRGRWCSIPVMRWTRPTGLMCPRSASGSAYPSPMSMPHSGDPAQGRGPGASGQLTSP
jgi:hypothetical protein